MDAAELRRLRKENAARSELERLGWYHAFRFEDGTEFPGLLPVEVSQHRYAQFPIPKDLTGKRVLDIGAWDGWFSFEAERHGAEVTAIDMVEMANFQTVHRKLRSRVAYRELDLFEVPQAQLGKFDYVFFLGVLYHTKYPLLALEIVCGLTQEIAIVESYVTDASDWRQHADDIPTLEFYEAEELGGQLDNWFGPTVGCLIAMCRAAGFARIEVLEVENNRAALACHRKWASSASESGKTLLRSVTNAIRLGVNFRSTREEYMMGWFNYEGDALHRDDVRLQVGPFGLPAMYVSQINGLVWSANARLPPGLEAGWYPVRLSLKGGAWSDPLKIAVDIPASAESLAIDLICDGLNWSRGEVDIRASPAHVSLWVRGLGQNSDVANTSVTLDGEKLKVHYVSAETENAVRQVNAELSPCLAEGPHQVVVRFANVESPPIALTARRF